MMTIKQIEVTVGEITKDYVNNEEQGVYLYRARITTTEGVYASKAKKLVVLSNK